MKRYLSILVFLVCCSLPFVQPVQADWWQRPCIEDRLDSRNPHPSVVPPEIPNVHPDIEHCPTATPQPVATPQPTTAPVGSSASDENPCAPGKPFVGPYCGWSPSVNTGGGGGGSAGSEGPRIGGPAVLGLSDTGSGDFIVSDLCILVGVLCLLLYVRSKVPVLAQRKPQEKLRPRDKYANHFVARYLVKS